MINCRKVWKEKPIVRRNLSSCRHDTGAVIKKMNPQITFPWRHYANRSNHRMLATSLMCVIATSIAPALPAFGQLTEADALTRQARYEDAIKLLTKTIANNQKRDAAAAYARRAMAYYHTEQNESAVSDAEKAIALDPAQVGAYIYGANALVAMGRKTEALTLLTRGVSANPNIKTLYVKRAEINEEAGKKELAKQDRAKAQKATQKFSNPGLPDKIDIDSYLASIQKPIKRRWFPKPDSSNSSTIAEVDFSIHHDGRISNIQVFKSSKNAKFDEQALNAVHSASPLPRLPAGTPPVLRYRFTFRCSPPSMVFHTRETKMIQYSDARDTDGNPISHTLTTLQGEAKGYRLEEELVDDSALISLKASYGNKTVFEKKLPRWQGLCEASLTLIDPETNEDCNKLPVARDINADRVPELILKQSDNSGHEPDQWFILQMAPDGAMKEIWHQTLQSADFKDFDNDGSYEITVDDQIFKNWNGASYSDWGSIQVILEADGTTYKPSRRFMFKKPPSQAKLESTIKELDKETKQYQTVCKANTKAVNPKIWTRLVEYLFSDNAVTAKTILERIYPGQTRLAVTANSPDHPIEDSQIMTRDEFWSSLVNQAKKSKNFQVLSPRI